MIDFQKELNAEQCAAATADGGPMLVLAAAGTGKTRTLVHRVAYLIGNGVPAERILLLTFTNRAAREMTERAEGLIGPGVGGIWSGTFHSICAKLLRRYGSFLGYRPGFTILDEDDQKKLMGQIVKDVAGKDAKDFVKKEFILKLVSDAANRERDFRTLVEIQQSKVALDVEKVVECGERYANRKRELGAMDFDDLIVNGLRLVRDVDGVRNELQERFLHVLVDEYQDTNSVQAQFTDLLAAKHRNIMVVGDDFQCIYTWRGAQFENIMEFPNRWSGCRIIKLERNYRSLAPILDVANVVMKDVAHQFEKTLRPYRSGHGIGPQLYRMWDGHAQAELIVKLVEHLRGQGFSCKDIAVLYRSHYTSIDIQLALTRARLPFRITSGVGVFEQMHVKDVLSFLRLMFNPHDEMSFFRLIGLLPGVGEASLRRYWVRLDRSFDPGNGMDRMSLDSMITPKAKVGWEGMQKAFAAARGHLADGDDGLLIEDFVHFFYGDHLHRQFDDEDASGRLEDLVELQAQIASFETGLKGFLEEVALMTNLDAQNRSVNSDDQMQLGTIHQAKGMEWPVVILPWLVDSVFPSARSVEDGNIDEERRLFYVAVTRAKDRLYMCVPRSMKRPDGNSFPVEQSQFVREIPKSLYNEHEVRSVTPAYERNRQYGDRWGGGGPSRVRPESSWRTTWRR
ncbi:MAG: ATP-dependent helicase [Verrucomicrobiota bacterium]|nr:ATP-dependent helicase [Verrucomicrobiota bacterium]